MPRVKWNKNHIFGILTSRAINWHINELILRGRLVGGHLGGLHDFSGPLPANNRYIFGILSSSPVEYHPCWVIWLREWSGCLVIELECPQVGRGGVFRKVTSNWLQTCSLHIALCIRCMIEVKKSFGKGYGWICALTGGQCKSMRKPVFALFFVRYCIIWHESCAGR